MESYIVRIYRREEQGNSPVRGMVERVGAVGQDAFGTKEELWNILSIAEKSRKRGKNPVSQKRKVNKKQDSYVP
jgi:hypothetical protein